MGTSSVGDVVLVPFPFSDLSASKLRPALLLADVGRGDWICAQITSNRYADGRAVEIGERDFVKGSLDRVSYVRPGKLFTADERLFRRAVARLSKDRFDEVIQAIIALLRGGV